MADRISNLPDSLLLQILSSLEIKEAIATCLLSKRWRFLWRNLPSLEFHDSSFHRLKHFLQFVDATLLLVDLKSVQKFVLICEHFLIPPVRVQIWFNALLSHNSVTYLEVQLHKWCPMMPLPSRVFTCNTISVLKLLGVSIDVSTADLPSLKVLHLFSIEFSDSDCLNLILSNCLHLEELVLKAVYSKDGYSSIINAGRLEHLLFADIPEHLFSREAFSNVRFLHFYNCSMTIERKAPTFHNLIHVETHQIFRKDDWSTLSYLQWFPKLQSLVIHQHFGKFSDFDEEEIEPAPDVPPCVSCHLKEFVLIGFQGSENEFEFVKLIMENAKVLRTVIVGTAANCVRDGFEMFKRISSYPICAENCTLFFDVPKENIEEAMRKCLTIRKLLPPLSFPNIPYGY